MSRIFDELDKAMDGICSERSLLRQHKEEGRLADSRERAEKLAALKRQIREGVYRPDIKDVARLLTGAVTR
ncbi:flagellar biosynthesis anti-sigma factor FlgM [Pseudodesulfovibrio senegalensis]|nr:flagellar biosynthesis anti-sigma factor FlgM [Pseudodesulfovibrio senegalensis]